MQCFHIIENWSLLCYHGYLWFIFNHKDNIESESLEFLMGSWNLIQGIQRMHFAALEQKMLLTVRHTLDSSLTHKLMHFPTHHTSLYSFSSHKHSTNSTWHNTHHSSGQRDHYIFTKICKKEHTQFSHTAWNNYVEWSTIYSGFISLFSKSASRQIKIMMLHNFYGHKRPFKKYSVNSFLRLLNQLLVDRDWDSPNGL